MSIGRQCLVKSFLSVHGPGKNLLIKIKKMSMDLVNDRGFMKMVHGPGPKRGSMDPWSMFCPHPLREVPVRVSPVNAMFLNCFGVRA